nr:reverse transcriptase domain-containing protein [Tanacetum cinerariifolium]
MLKFLQIFQRLHFDLSFADALLHIPKFSSMFKSLLSNKEKLFELANTPLIENCSAILLKKLPKKLRDPERFLIPCDFLGLESCMALADIGASINLMPLSIWKKLSLPDLTPTRMTLKLATRSYAYRADIAEDIFVQVGKFTFPPDFIVIGYDVDPRIPFILWRPFLRTAHALVDVHGEELILRDEFIDEPALDYLPPPGDVNDDDDDLFNLKSDNDEWKKLLYGDCYKDIDSKKDKNKDSKMKLLIVKDHIVESNDVLPWLLDNDSILPEESSVSSEIASLSLSPFGNKDK